MSDQIEISEDEFKRLKKAGAIAFQDIYGANYILTSNFVLRAKIYDKDETIVSYELPV